MNKHEQIKEIEDCLIGISETPYLDALFFVEHCIKNRIDITPEKTEDFIRRIKLGEPVSKIIEERGFWALDFKVSKDVLDPRSDSETIIETVLKYFSDKAASLDILDIGSGSGCLLISLLYEYQNAKGIGVDVSERALNVAVHNAKGYNALFLKKDFYQSDFVNDLPLFDIIVSNPPYIKTKDIETLDKNVRLYDPLIALDGGEDGLDAYRALSKTIKYLLKRDGKVFFEIGQGQENDVKKIMKDEGYTFLEQWTDLGKIVRVLVFSYNFE